MKWKCAPNLNDTNRIEPGILSTATTVWVASLVGEDARPTDPVIVRPMIMSVDPELRLVCLDQSAEIRDEGWR